jgi:hypothetical protein
MSLIDKFEEGFLEDFNKLKPIEIEDYIRENKKAIKFLCDNNSEISGFIEEVLEKHVIIKEVREKYYEKLLRGCNRELLEHPEYLAYVLRNNILSPYELRKINLENDYIRNAFIKKHSDEKLLKKFRERLLSP